MSEEWIDLDSDQIDALQEIGNIGSGHAANALAELLNRKVDMSLPRFSILTPREFNSVKWSEMKDASTETQIIAVSICQTKGDLDADIIVVLDEKTLRYLLTVINKNSQAIEGMDNLGILDKSIALEVGSILSLHYLTALNTFLSMKAFPETPYLNIDKA